MYGKTGQEGYELFAGLDTLNEQYRIHIVKILPSVKKQNGELYPVTSRYYDAGTGTVKLQKRIPVERGFDGWETVYEWTMNPFVANKFCYLMDVLGKQKDPDMILDEASGAADLVDLITGMIELAAIAAQVQWNVEPNVESVNHSI